MNSISLVFTMLIAETELEVKAIVIEHLTSICDFHFEEIIELILELIIEIFCSGIGNI